MKGTVAESGEKEEVLIEIASQVPGSVLGGRYQLSAISFQLHKAQ